MIPRARESSLTLPLNDRDITPFRYARQNIAQVFAQVPQACQRDVLQLLAPHIHRPTSIPYVQHPRQPVVGSFSTFSINSAALQTKRHDVEYARLKIAAIRSRGKQNTWQSFPLSLPDSAWITRRRDKNTARTAPETVIGRNKLLRWHRIAERCTLDKALEWLMPRAKGDLITEKLLKKCETWADQGNITDLLLSPEVSDGSPDVNQDQGLPSPFPYTPADAWTMSDGPDDSPSSDRSHGDHLDGESSFVNTDTAMIIDSGPSCPQTTFTFLPSNLSIHDTSIFGDVSSAMLATFSSQATDSSALYPPPDLGCDDVISPAFDHNVQSPLLSGQLSGTQRLTLSTTLEDFTTVQKLSGQEDEVRLCMKGLEDQICQTRHTLGTLTQQATRLTQEAIRLAGKKQSIIDQYQRPDIQAIFSILTQFKQIDQCDKQFTKLTVPAVVSHIQEPSRG